jgi:hypothetical protein
MVGGKKSGNAGKRSETINSAACQENLNIERQKSVPRFEGDRKRAESSAKLGMFNS